MIAVALIKQYVLFCLQGRFIIEVVCAFYIAPDSGYESYVHPHNVCSFVVRLILYAEDAWAMMIFPTIVKRDWAYEHAAADAVTEEDSVYYVKKWEVKRKGVKPYGNLQAEIKIMKARKQQAIAAEDFALAQRI